MKKYFYTASPPIPTIQAVVEACNKLQDDEWEVVFVNNIGVGKVAPSGIITQQPQPVILYELVIRKEIVDGKVPDMPKINIDIKMGQNNPPISPN